MKYDLIIWVSLNILALWYCLYLMKRGNSFLTNCVQLYTHLKEKSEMVKTEEQARRYQSILLAAEKTAKVGLTYLLLGGSGVLGLLVMNVRLL